MRREDATFDRAVSACGTASEAFGGFLVALLAAIWAAVWAVLWRLEPLSTRATARLRDLDIFGPTPLLGIQRRLADAAHTKELEVLDVDVETGLTDVPYAAAVHSSTNAAPSTISITIPLMPATAPELASPNESMEPRCLEFFVGTPPSPRSPAARSQGSSNEGDGQIEAPAPTPLPLAGQLARAAMRRLVEAEKLKQVKQLVKEASAPLAHAHEASLAQIPTPARKIALSARGYDEASRATCTQRPSSGLRGVRSAANSRCSSGAASRASSGEKKASAPCSRSSSNQPQHPTSTKNSPRETVSHQGGGRLRVPLRSRPSSPAIPTPRGQCQSRGSVGNSSVGSVTGPPGAVIQPRWRH